MSLLPVQTQAFLLYGNGAVIGDTQLILSSFKDIDGNLLTMQGTVMTGTVEPSSGSQEEQIIFTGVTQNSNGTATLTGVSSVAFASPYTTTSGFKKSHAGNTTFVLSDTAYLYSQYASLANTQTFTGSNTFSISPIIPTVASTATTQAASVGYVNSVAIAGGAKASNTVFGITQLSVAPATASVPIAVGTNDPRIATASQSLALAGDGGAPSNINTYVTQQGFQVATESYSLTSGSSTAYTIAFSPSTSGLGYTTGEMIKFKTHTASGSSPTINKDSNGAKSIYKVTSSGTTALAVGDLGTNQMCIAEYDGGAYQLISPIAPTPYLSVGMKNGTVQYDMSTASGTKTIAHGLGVVPKIVKLQGSWVVGGFLVMSNGSYNGSTMASNSSSGVNSGYSDASTSYILNFNSNSGNSQTATIAADVTNITLTWTKTGSPTGNTNYSWEAWA